jgi:hypothetical protein
MKVVFDDKQNLYLCIGHGFAFKAWFAGQGERQAVEAEIFDKRGACIDVLQMDAPEGAVPTSQAVADAFEPRLKMLREQLAN